MQSPIEVLVSVILSLQEFHTSLSVCQVAIAT